MCLGCWGLLWLCVCLSLHRDTGNCATLIPAIGTVCLAPLYNADKLSSGGLSTEPALTHTYTHALFIVGGAARKRESVEVVVGKKHEIREKMVSSKNWQTLESFFLSSLMHTHTHTKICSGRRECSCCPSSSRRFFIPLDWRVVTCFEHCCWSYHDNYILCDRQNIKWNKYNSFEQS